MKDIYGQMQSRQVCLRRCQLRSLPRTFYPSLHEFSSISTFIPEIESHPVGILGLVETVQQHSEQSFGAVVASARAIENQLHANLIVREANAKTAELH